MKKLTRFTTTMIGPGFCAIAAALIIHACGPVVDNSSHTNAPISDSQNITGGGGTSSATAITLSATAPTLTVTDAGVATTFTTSIELTWFYPALVAGANAPVEIWVQPPSATDFFLLGIVNMTNTTGSYSYQPLAEIGEHRFYVSAYGLKSNEVVATALF
ncbi:MAG: hypothetical protein HZB29_09740 [Nitrospinae bacterium]|nr:hypothetical protein [Nitrospinota bacterium]